MLWKYGWRGWKRQRWVEEGKVRMKGVKKAEVSGRRLRRRDRGLVRWIEWRLLITEVSVRRKLRSMLGMWVSGKRLWMNEWPGPEEFLLQWLSRCETRWPGAWVNHWAVRVCCRHWFLLTLDLGWVDGLLTGPSCTILLRTVCVWGCEHTGV